MSRWFYIGGSTFDGDMDVSEKIVNFMTVGDKIDVDALYYYYRSSLLSYWIKLDELLALKSPKEFEEFYSKTDHIGRRAYLATKESSNLQNTAHKYDHYKQIFDDKLSLIEQKYHQLIENLPATKKINFNYKNFAVKADNYDNNEPDFKFDFIREIYLCFYFIAKISCGEKYNGDPSVNENNAYSKGWYLFPITNNSGWHSYNSYLYALSHGLHIVGFPSTISTADGIFMCPKRFAEHDLLHINSTMFSRDAAEIRYYYENVLKSDLTRNQKEVIIFTIWMTVHELSEPRLRDLNYKTMTEYASILTQSLTFGICLSDDTIDEIKGLIDQLRSKPPTPLKIYIKMFDDYFEYVVQHGGSSAGYGKAHRTIQFMALFYGLHYLMSLKPYVNEPDEFDEDI